MARITDETKTAMEVVMPIEAKEQLKALAGQLTTKGKTVSASDIVRNAVAEYVLEKYGVQIILDVDRGGYRERKPA